jgi:glycosyltransferase involved in cell wall biosynthesis
MSKILRVAPERIVVCPLSIDAKDLLAEKRAVNLNKQTVGYLARIAPEKGLHLLVDAFIQLKRNGQFPDAKLEIAGWMGKQNESYWDKIASQLTRANLQNDYRFWGTIDRTQKLKFLSSIDLLSVPTIYQEPKGLFALEAMAAGVPYLLPAHGAFPELHARAQIGRLHKPDNVDDLAASLREMLSDIEGTRQLSDSCRDYVKKYASPEAEAAALLKAIAID